jgi:hypothetical protein
MNKLFEVNGVSFDNKMAAKAVRDELAATGGGWHEVHKGVDHSKYKGKHNKQAVSRKPPVEVWPFPGDFPYDEIN